MSQELLEILTSLTSFILLCSSVIGLLGIAKLHSFYRTIVHYIFFITVIQIGSSILSAFGIYNRPIAHLYTFGEFSILSIFFYQLYLKSVFKNKRILRIAYFLGLVCLIADSIFVTSLFEFNTFAKAIVQFVIICYCFFYFYIVIHKTTKDSYVQGAGADINLIITGLIIYYAGSILIFLFGKFIVKSSESIFFNIWNINALLSIVCYMIIFIALWKHLYKRKKSST